MATKRKPRAAKTSEELKKQLEEARKRLADLEKRAYAEELTEHIKATNIVAEFASIQAKVTGIKETAILAAIGAAVGIKRLIITQAQTKSRKPSDPSKPKKSRAPRKSKA